MDQTKRMRLVESPLPATGDEEGRTVDRESPVRPSGPIVNQQDSGAPHLDVDEILRRSEPKIKHCVFKAGHGR